MMKNSEARRFSKRYHTANPPPTGRITINKTPKNRYFTNASRHSFCFFAVAYIASFMFKFCLYLKFTQRTACISFSLALEANFSEIYAVKVRVWASKQLNLKKNRSNLTENKRS